MEAKDWITVAALIAGPILAVQVQRFLESLRDRRNRRVALFRSLMATRAARVSAEHVQALNMIDIEFYGRRIGGTQFQTPAEKTVTNAWKNYNDHLNHAYPLSELPRWSESGNNLLAKLLFEMSKALGYDFDEVELKRNVYSPIAHGKLEEQQAAIRAGVENLLAGKSRLAVVAYAPPPPAAALQQRQPPPQEPATPALSPRDRTTASPSLSVEQKAEPGKT